jgi:hypothetical protein
MTEPPACPRCEGDLVYEGGEARGCVNGGALFLIKDGLRQHAVPPPDDTAVEPVDLGAYRAAAEESCVALLGEISALLRRFVVMSVAQALVVALWTIHTYLFEASDATGYLAVTSPEKRSGKTRLLEVLDLLVARPWFTGRTTAAVLPRKIDADSPTLLLDESDAAFNSDKEYSEALRGVLNTGHRRGGKTTVCVGQGPSIGFKDFATFCPKAIAWHRQAARHCR